jgi:hypothetical protein
MMTMMMTMMMMTMMMMDFQKKRGKGITSSASVLLLPVDEWAACLARERCFSLPPAQSGSGGI